MPGSGIRTPPTSFHRGTRGCPARNPASTSTVPREGRRGPPAGVFLPTEARSASAPGFGMSDRQTRSRGHRPAGYHQHMTDLAIDQRVIEPDAPQYNARLIRRIDENDSLAYFWVKFDGEPTPF